MRVDGLLRVVLWISLVLGGLVLAFVLFFLLGNLFGSEGFGSFGSIREIVMFAFFPFGLATGLALAYWRRLWGGLIAFASMVVFFAFEPHLLGDWKFIVFTLPGLGYLAYDLLSRMVRSS